MLHLFNTVTKQKELFKPLDDNHVRMYVCGPTVYDFPHIGNARPVVVFDVLFRLLKMLYPKVTYVRNITDVDDKINAAAAQNQEDIQSLTKRTINFYQEDMRALNALPPSYEPCATTHIPDMICMIETLIDKGYAYENAQHVLFRIKAYEGYGNLSRRAQKELLAGARVEVAPYKEDAGDFVLWKPSSPDLPGWESPWGRGRPGWHIECSAMSKAFLGDTFDIHGGGIDLVFPHHENELAQSCSANDTKFMATYWLHNGHLLVNGEKMSKSLGNFITVRELLKETPGEVIRFILLSTYYRQPLDFTRQAITTAKSVLDRFYKALEFCTDDQVYISPQVQAALLDDLNTPLAISHLHELANSVFKTAGQDQIKAANALKASGQILGLFSLSLKEWFQGNLDLGIDSEKIEQFINERNAAKKEKDFAKADAIRQCLVEQGIVLEDSAQGTSWRKF